MFIELVPTKVVDKNGKQTTVHKKPSSSAEPSKPLPAPSLRATKLGNRSKMKTVREVARTLAAHPSFDGDDKTAVSLLSKYSIELLEALYPVLGEDSNLSRHITKSVKNGYSEGTVREHLVFSDSVPHATHHYMESMVKSLHSYPQLPDTDDLTSMGPEVIEQCKALLLIEDEYSDVAAATGKSLYKEKDPTCGLADGGLVTLIMDYPHELERIKNIMIAGGTQDPVTIREALNSDTPSFSSGIL